MTTYENSKELCEKKNLTLPKTEFRIVEDKFKYPTIFWIAENEESKTAAENDDNNDLALIPDNKHGCVIITHNSFLGKKSF